MPELSASPEPRAYQLRVVLRGISPLIWRRRHRHDRPAAAIPSRARARGNCRGRRTARVDAAALREAVQLLVADLLTVESVQTALNNSPTDRAERAIIQATLAGQEQPDTLVGELGAVSPGARALAFVRLLDRGDTLLVNPMEIAGEAEGGCAEFTSRHDPALYDDVPV